MELMSLSHLDMENPGYGAMIPQVNSQRLDQQTGEKIVKNVAQEVFSTVKLSTQQNNLIKSAKWQSW